MTRDDGLYAQVRHTIDDLETTARNAQEITDDLRSGEGTMGKALTDDSLYTEAQDTLRTVNRATQSVEDPPRDDRDQPVLSRPFSRCRSEAGGGTLRPTEAV